MSIRVSPFETLLVPAEIFTTSADKRLPAISNEVRVRVDAIACSCFWHSLLALDGRGRPLTPLLTWRDVRSAQLVSE